MPAPGRIDVHFHIIPQFFQEAVKSAGLGPARRAGYPPYSAELGVELMDANGIQTAITSVGAPGVQFLDARPAKLLARKLNEYATELGTRFPGRYGAFSTLPMGDIEHAVEEIEYCLDRLNHQGVWLFASYGEKFLGDPVFDPVLDTLNQREAVCFVHPALHPSSRRLDLNVPGGVMEYLFDTTRAAVNLILSSALDHFPKIKFILAHAGGTLPYFSWRLAAAPKFDSTLPQWPREKFEGALRHFWYDNALACGPSTMGALKTVADPQKILFGSDWPFVQAPLVAEAVATHQQSGLHTVLERAAIDRGNALMLFPGLN
jgi:6-methylsalicylate decarboxylase